MEEYNRENVNRIKKMIIFIVILLCTVPTILCIYLMVRLNRMEKKLDSYISAPSVSKTDGDADIYNQGLCNEEKFAEDMDRKAYEQIEKESAEAKYLTMQEDIDSVNQTGETTESVEQADATDGDILNGKKVYLTFDDGPSIYTEEILDILQEENVKATFFVVAKDESYNDDYNRIVSDGHTLAMHSYSHEYNKVYADLDSFKEDVDSIHDLLYDVTGVDVKYYRFPGGSSNTVSHVDIQSCISYLDEKGYTYFDWNALNGDAVTDKLTPEQLNDNIMKYVRNNQGDSVVLMHDMSARHTTVEALPELIHTLKEEGYELVPIDDDTIPVQHVKDQNK